jgi:flagellar biosynthetic protein FliR
MMDFSPLARFALLLVRPGMIVAVAPGIGGAHLPAPVKLGLTVLLAIGLVPAVPVPDVAGNVTLTAVVAREAAIGLALAFVLRALIAGAELAGHVSGIQIGFSYGATIDPQSGVSNTMLATLYGSLATMGILAVNGHHHILRALAASYAGAPIGTSPIGVTLPDAVRDMLGLLFVVGARLAAPIVIVLLLVELVVGLISRSAPSLNFMVIGYPLRLLVGLTLLAALVPVVPSVVNSMLEQAVALSARTAMAFR